jgi:hypothetical protein
VLRSFDHRLFQEARHVTAVGALQHKVAVVVAGSQVITVAEQASGEQLQDCHWDHLLHSSAGLPPFLPIAICSDLPFSVPEGSAGADKMRAGEPERGSPAHMPDYLPFPLKSSVMFA